MSYKDEIKSQCEALSNQELLIIVNNKIRYTHQIVTAAQIELTKRNIPKEEKQLFLENQKRLSKIINGNIEEDIHLGDKILFFFLFLPRLNFWVRRDYRKKGFLLKLRQAGYYSLSGSAFLMVIVVIGMNRISLLAGVVLWITSFFVAHAVNLYFVRQIIKRNLEKRLGKNAE